jgi:hypothetical protein
MLRKCSFLFASDVFGPWAGASTEATGAGGLALKAELGSGEMCAEVVYGWRLHAIVTAAVQGIAKRKS